MTKRATLRFARSLLVRKLKMDGFSDLVERQNSSTAC